MVYPKIDLSEKFPQDAELIVELHRTDPVFAEICDDYQGLCALEPRDANDKELVSETLKGLQEEIARHLERAKETSECSDKLSAAGWMKAITTAVSKWRRG